MITPRLEDLILQGKARFKNWSFGVGQCGGIPIPDNNILIITGFTWFGCLLKQKDQGENPVLGSENINLLRIESDKNVNDYVIRNLITSIPVQVEDEIIYKHMPASNIKFDTYLVCAGEVQIRIGIVPKADQFGLTTGSLPAIANEEEAPLGFSGEEVVLNVDLSGDSGNYNPLDNKRQPHAPGRTTQDREQFNINFNGVTFPKISESIEEYVDNGYPIINFELVYIDKAFINSLIASK